MLSQKFNISIKRDDIRTLAGLNWLNDEVNTRNISQVLSQRSAYWLVEVRVTSCSVGHQFLHEPDNGEREGGGRCVHCSRDEQLLLPQTL